MKEIRFTRPEPGACPKYGDYFIQDRAYGRDVYGNESYQYALYRKRRFQTVKRFRTRKQAYEYLSKITGLTRWDILHRSASIIINDREYLGISHGGEFIRLVKRTREIQTRPEEDERITGWYDRMNDCVAEAKQIIKGETS